MENIVDFPKEWGFLDYVESVTKGYVIGYASIGFRTHANPSYDINHNNFYLNSTGDGWFRKDRYAGPATGYGLCIDKIRITSMNAILVGEFLCYKCVIDYTTAEELPMTDKFWLFVHKKFEVNDVLNYIETNKKNWRP